ncbi:MAG: hypothetical protein WC581_12710 [Thermodesulfovibrionales bacterium]
MNKKNLLIIIFAFVILLSTFFYVYLSVKLFDSDFWWHIATGKYIVETGTIPDRDPFSFTANREENQNLLPGRENFLLKQYWLGQTIFYLIFDLFGPKGIIALRALILFMVLLLVLWRLMRMKVSFYIIFVFIFFVYLDLTRFTGERPVLFTILFTVLTFIMLEEFKQKKTKIILLLIPLMLLWANLHGGFIIGVGIIGIYMIFEGIKIILKKADYTKQEISLFYIVTILALGASYINPTGWEAFSIALSPKYKFLETGIQEYQSPFVLYFNKLSSIDYGYVLLVVLFPVILLLRNRKIDVTNVILLAGLFIMAVKSGRYTIYYVSIAAIVLGKETDILVRQLFTRISEKTFTKIHTAFAVFALISSLIFFVGVVKFQWLQMDVARGSFVPEGTVDFVEENKLEGNMLNTATYGGYIAWRLYPWKKTFIDTRWLNYTVQQEFAWIANTVESLSGKEPTKGKKPLWKRLLKNYDINFVVIETLDVYGNVPKLLLTLTEDDDWAPVYAEPMAFVFIRNIPKNSTIIEKFRLQKDQVYSTVIMVAAQMAIYKQSNPKYLTTLGKTFYSMGRLNDALTAYEYALQRFPKEQYAHDMVARIKSELKDKDEKH